MSRAEACQSRAEHFEEMSLPSTAGVYAGMIHSQAEQSAGWDQVSTQFELTVTITTEARQDESDLLVEIAATVRAWCDALEGDV